MADSERIVWQFDEETSDGEAWLRRPRDETVFILYQSTASSGAGEWRRLFVVTRAWLQAQLSDTWSRGLEVPWAVLPSMLVLPDLEGDELRAAVDAVVNQRGFDAYSTPA